MVDRSTVNATMRKAVLELLLAGRRPFTLKVRGESMLPFLATDDIVTIAPCSASEVSVGDIVAYQNETGIAVHRVLRKLTGNGEVKLYQAGDNLLGGSWLREAQIVGRVVAVRHSNDQDAATKGLSVPTRSECWRRYLRIQLREWRSLLLRRL